MNRFLVALAVAVSAVLVLPGVASAVTIKEFPLTPGRTPGQVSPYYVKAGPDGNLWVVNRGTDNGILRISTAGAPQQPVEAGSPQDIAVGASGNVYWTETPAAAGGAGAIVRLGNGSIQRFNGLASPFGVAVNPYSIALTPAETIFTGMQISSTTPGANGIQGGCRIYGATFQLTCSFKDPAPVKSRYTSAVAVGAGDMWVAAFEENVLRRFAVPTGNTVDDEPVEGVTVALPANSGPSRMVLGPDGNLWITMFNANAIDRFSLTTAARTRFQLPPGLKGPTDITVGPDGALWFTEFLGNAVGRITTTGQIQEFLAPTAGSAPYGITTGPDGNIWFTQNATASIARLTLDAPGGPGGTGGGGGGVTDTVAPRFTEALDVSRSSFRPGTTSRRGTTFEFSLSEPAKVKITIERKASETGRKVNGKCVRRTRSNRKRQSCTRYTSLGSLTRDGRQGANAVKFSGKLNGRNLRGAYRASAVATDAAGNASKPSTVTFTVRSR
jgi:streptogramin lyase